MRFIVDIETDAIDAKVIHCIVAKNIDTEEVLTWHGDTLKDFASWAETVDIFIMHNGISFDAPVLNKLTGSKIKLSQVRDTLILSQLSDPMLEGGHSLKAWGERLGFGKIEYNDFSHFNEEMLKYCIQDVQLTHKLYRHLLPKLKKFSKKSMLLEHEIRAIVNRQEQNGFTLDVKSATILCSKLEAEASQIEKDLQTVFPPITEERYSEKTGKRLSDKVEHFNPNSRQQISKRLIEKGWKPENLTPTGHPIVDEGTLKRVKNIPEALQIAHYLLLQKRVSQIKSWIDVVQEDGKVHGRVMTLKAISGRMAPNSPNMAQVPASYSPYGKECRSVWIPTNDKYTLVGCDASSLELRCLAHYMGDKKFTNEVVDGDIHTANQKAAGLKTRDQAKTFIYALIYGAGAEKIGSIVGGGKKEGQRVISQFMKNMPALKALRDKVDRVAKTGFVRGLDGRLLKVRQYHASMNLLLQGAGAIICKEWLRQITYKVQQAYDYKLVASIHDEYQFEVRRDQAERFGEITKQAMKLTQKELSIHCPLDSEYKIGKNWYETH